MSAAPKPCYTPEEYLALERQAETRSEYYAGEIFAMAGASKEHNTIAFNLSGILHPQLRGSPCQGFGSDMRVKVNATGLYTYPDVVVVCGEPQFEDAEVDTLLNPTFLIEILSSTTEAYVRGDKWEQYRQLESLQEYVLIAQDRVHIEKYVRQPDRQWLFSESSEREAVVSLPSIGCQLSLAEVYDRLVFEEHPPASPDERPDSDAKG